MATIIGCLLLDFGSFKLCLRQANNRMIPRISVSKDM